MAGRILGRQQLVSNELGRLRMGTYEGNRPVASKTWILTSPIRRYLDHAAALRHADGSPVYGGTVHEWQPQGKGSREWRLITQVASITALLGPGDPVSQYNEMWSAGGNLRRCNEITEERSGNPCLCRAQFGDNFHEQPDGKVCKTHTRINVFVEDLLGAGFWRVETKGFYASGRVPGMIDFVKAIVGPAVLIPIELTIVQRTKVEGGKTSRYTELVADIPGYTLGQFRRGELGDLTSVDSYRPRQIAEAAQPAIEGRPVGQSPPQLEARNGNPAPVSAGQGQRGGRPAVDSRPANRAAPTSPARPPRPADDGVTQSFEKLIAEATTLEEMGPLWNSLIESGAPETVKELWRQRRTEIRTGTAAPAAIAEAAPVDGEAEPDREEMWQAALSLAGKLGWNTQTTSQRFREEMGKDPAQADGWTHEQFRDALKTGAIK